MSHHHEVASVCVASGAFFSSTWSVGGPGWNFPSRPLRTTNTICHIHLLPPDDGPKTGPEHVESWLFNKLKTNGASYWLIIQT
jgi:hypothetical protein